MFGDSNSLQRSAAFLILSPSSTVESDRYDLFCSDSWNRGHEFFRMAAQPKKGRCTEYEKGGDRVEEENKYKIITTDEERREELRP